MAAAGAVCRFHWVGAGKTIYHYSRRCCLVPLCIMLAGINWWEELVLRREDFPEKFSIVQVVKCSVLAVWPFYLMNGGGGASRVW